MSKELGYETQAQESLQAEINSHKIGLERNVHNQPIHFMKSEGEKQRLKKAKFNWKKEQKPTL